MKKLAKKILSPVVGKKMFQNFYESLFELSIFGMNYGNGGDFSNSGELFVLKYIAKKFNDEKSLIIFDGGGNIGNYSKHLSEVFSTKATIHSFEPSKGTYKIFLETNKNIPNIVPNNLGLSDIETYQILYTNGDGSPIASLYKRDLDHIGINMDKSEEIKLTTIDVYCEKNNISRINFLKLDIEGNELKALNGATQLLNNKKIDLIQFEFGGCNIDSRTFFKDFYDLLNNNYKIYRILKDGLFEIPKYEDTYEIFYTVNFLAVLK